MGQSAERQIERGRRQRRHLTFVYLPAVSALWPYRRFAVRSTQSSKICFLRSESQRVNTVTEAALWNGYAYT
jgi:hypothetical protein